MRNKRLVNSVVLEFFHLKKLGIAYFVPCIVLFGVIPLFSAGNIWRYGFGEHANVCIWIDFQRYIPLFGSWWIILGLSDCVGGQLAPIFKLHRSSLLMDFFLLYFWYFLHVTVLFAGFAIILENFWPEFPVIMIQTFFFASVGFSLLVASKSTMPPFVVLLGYEMTSMLTEVGASLSISIVLANRLTTVDQLLLPYVPVMLVCLALLLVSNVVFFKRRKD